VTQAAAVIAAFVQEGRTLAVAESLTGGALSAELVSVPGASAVVRGAVVAYDTALKSSLLGVPADLLAEAGPVDPRVAALMAEGVRVAAAVGGHPADVGVATTGVAGPDPQGDAPVGRVYVAVADSAGSEVRELQLGGDRAAIRAQTVDAALALVLSRISADQTDQ